jgi:hypothetical protein
MPQVLGFVRPPDILAGERFGVTLGNRKPGEWVRATLHVASSTPGRMPRPQQLSDRPANGRPSRHRMGASHRIQIVIKRDGQSHRCTMVQWCNRVKTFFRSLLLALDPQNFTN